MLIVRCQVPFFVVPLINCMLPKPADCVVEVLLATTVGVSTPDGSLMVAVIVKFAGPCERLKLVRVMALLTSLGALVSGGFGASTSIVVSVVKNDEFPSMSSRG
ncbi:hypothetical protein ASF89_12390 [Frigoribacterium sp. Leaf172]|nr:hypothetical protein ASF89_12390 [Frigoribacterium sp. Leaf172]